MIWRTWLSVSAVVAGLIVAPAVANADCGDTGQSLCAGAVPIPDQVVAVMAELTDPNIPAVSKTNVVTPGFSPEEAANIDDHLNQMDTRYGVLPYTFVVTDIQPASAGLAGATVTTAGSYHQRSAPEPIVLADRGGHWLITHDTAMTALNNFWHNASHWLINRT
jgi:hypothetical protein